MKKITTKKVAVGPCTLHYLTCGKVENPNVLLLHGKKFNAATWKELSSLIKLADEGYRAVALDLPGFGESLECEADALTVLKWFIRQEKLTRPVLVGPSMSGKISLEFALTDQDLLSGLVLVGSVGVKENRNRLKELHLPTLLMWGEKDAVSPVENARILHEGIKDSHLVIIPDASHPCYLDKPDIWHKELLQFLHVRFMEVT